MANLIDSIRRDVGWLQSFGFVFPWQTAWWGIAWRRFTLRMETVDVD